MICRVPMSDCERFLSAFPPNNSWERKHPLPKWSEITNLASPEVAKAFFFFFWGGLCEVGWLGSDWSSRKADALNIWLFCWRFGTGLFGVGASPVPDGDAMWNAWRLGAPRKKPRYLCAVLTLQKLSLMDVELDAPLNLAWDKSLMNCWFLLICCSKVARFQ